MDNKNLSKIDHIDWLKARVKHLESSNRWYYTSLEMLASLGDLHRDVQNNMDPSALFKTAGEKLSALINFQTLAFFHVDLPSSGFVLTDCFPDADKNLIQTEIDRQVEKGTFAWAVKQNRALAVEGELSPGKLILHSISTKSRILGLFAGRLKDNLTKIPAEKLTLISVILHNTAHAIENGRLYKRVTSLNQVLEKAVSTRTRELEDQAEELKQEVSARKKTKEAYQKLARQNEMILNSADEGILGIDVNGNITFVNSRGAQLTGYEPEEMIGLPIHSLFNPAKGNDSASSHNDNPVQKVIDNNSSLSLEDETFRKKGGQEIPVEYSCGAIRESGKPMGAVVTFRDVSERIKIQEEQIYYEENLLRSNKALQDFAFIASHDLQEPLRKLLMFSGRLKTDCGHYMDGKAKDYLDNIEKFSVKMRELLEGLLEYSTITTEAGPFENTNLSNVISAVLSDLLDPIIKSGARIKVGPLPVIEADISQMRQLFFNLLLNCLKFQKPNEPLVVRISGQPEKNGFWNINISDNGIGFDEKHLEKIFEPFKQLHNSSEYGGQGIGLTICQKIANRHGGRVTAKSVANEGSSFTIRLPEKQSGSSC